MIVNGNTLRMVKGDTESITINVDGYELTADDTVTMTVKSFGRKDASGNLVAGTTKCFERTAIINDGSAVVTILPSDTKTMTAGRYVYDIELVTNTGAVHTIVPINVLELIDEVTT